MHSPILTLRTLLPFLLISSTLASHPPVSPHRRQLSRRQAPDAGGGGIGGGGVVVPTLSGGGAGGEGTTVLTTPVATTPVATTPVDPTPPVTPTTPPATTPPATTPLTTPVTPPTITVPTTAATVVASSSVPPLTSAVVPTTASSTASTSAASIALVTVISIVTNSDGTSTATLLSSPTSLNAATSSPSNTGKTWGIIGGVIGGVAILAAGIFVVWRLSQKRFADLSEGAEDIKWPELRPDGQSGLTSTLNPLGTRRTGGAGVEMERDGSEWGGDNSREGRPTSSYEHLSYGAPSQANDPYYDPYLGHSASPYPPPQNIYPPAPYASSVYCSPEQTEYATSSDQHHQTQQDHDPFARSASSLSAYDDSRFRPH